MHHPICYYIPAHMLGHINLARARGLAEPGPEQQTARVSEAFRQRRRQALVNLNPTPPNPTPPPSRLTRMPPQSGGRSTVPQPPEDRVRSPRRYRQLL